MAKNSQNESTSSLYGLKNPITNPLNLSVMLSNRFYMYTYVRSTIVTCRYSSPRVKLSALGATLRLCCGEWTACSIKSVLTSSEVSRTLQLQSLEENLSV